ncbi:hypothetical protein DM02DRAFT_546887, partial [Periconia macrospinosa]
GWTKIPALAKLHHVAVWLRNSSTHSNVWDDQIKLRLGIDNQTRWNSWYNVLDKLIKKTQIKQFLLDRDSEIGDNMLNNTDWLYLERTHAFLEPFASSTLYAQGARIGLSQSLKLMDALLMHYEQKLVSYSLFFITLANLVVLRAL